MVRKADTMNTPPDPPYKTSVAGLNRPNINYNLISSFSDIYQKYVTRIVL